MSRINCLPFNRTLVKVPFEARLLLLVGLCLILFGCGSGEPAGSDEDTILSAEEVDIGEYPIVYVSREQPIAETNLLILDAFNPGAQLYTRIRPSNDAVEVNISQMIFGEDATYDIGDISMSYDGTLMVFAARGPYVEGLEEGEEQPSTWNLYEYNFATGEVAPIMNNEDAALGHDITPHYLADGRIIFSSSRQQRTGTIMLDEGKPRYQYQVETDSEDERFGPGFALHIAEFDGNRNLTAIEQVTFHRSHDFDPVLLDNGKVVFTRWDTYGERDQVSLYQMNPDGAELEILFGYRSHDEFFADTSAQFTNPTVSVNSDELIAFLKPFDNDGLSATRIAIDYQNFVDVNVPIPGANASGDGIISEEVIVPPADEAIYPEGRYSAITELFDGSGRRIVSWNLCRLLQEDGTVRSCRNIDPDDEDLQEAPPSYGIWLEDPANNTRIPLILADGYQAPYYQIAIARPRAIPESIRDTQIRLASPQDNSCDQGFFAEDDGYGMLHIRSVYDMDGSFYTDWAPEGVTSISQLRDPVAITAAQRSARFVRFEKPVYNLDPELKEIPGRDMARFGPFMREILGYAPVQPDGSVKVKVPADIPLMLTIVDQYGRRVAGSSDHLSWLQVRPGEVKECHGCHQPDSEYPHGRRDAQNSTLNRGAISMSMFPNTNPQAYEVDISINQDGSAFTTCLPNSGETMAEVFVRTKPSRADLSADMVFQDIWTDPDQRLPDDSFAYRYSSVQSVYDAGQDLGDDSVGAVPLNRGECVDEWNAFCRVVINYETHIQPLFEVTRNVTTEEGLTPYKCIDCHSDVDPDGLAQIPAGQLSLVGEIENNRPISYRDLMDNAFAFIDQGDGSSIEADNLSARDMDNAVIPELEKQLDGRYCYRWEDGRLINAAIVNETEEVPVLDDEGNPVLDENENPVTEIVEVLDDDGHPIPLTYSIRENNLGLNVRLSRNGATSSDRFRRVFQPDFAYSYFDCGLQQNVVLDMIDFDHSAAGMFSESELKLIWEWLDIGSAYYNNPFDVPD